MNAHRHGDKLRKQKPLRNFCPATNDSLDLPASFSRRSTGLLNRQSRAIALTGPNQKHVIRRVVHSLTRLPSGSSREQQSASGLTSSDIDEQEPETRRRRRRRARPMLHESALRGASSLRGAMEALEKERAAQKVARDPPVTNLRKDCTASPDNSAETSSIATESRSSAAQLSADPRIPDWVEFSKTEELVKKRQREFNFIPVSSMDDQERDVGPGPYGDNRFSAKWSFTADLEEGRQGPSLTSSMSHPDFTSESSHRSSLRRQQGLFIPSSNEESENSEADLIDAVEIESRTSDKAVQVCYEEIKMATGWTTPLIMKRFRKRVVNVSSLVLPLGGSGSGVEKRKRSRGLCWSAYRFLARRARWNRVRLDFWLLSETEEVDAVREKAFRLRSRSHRLTQTKRTDRVTLVRRVTKRICRQSPLLRSLSRRIARQRRPFRRGKDDREGLLCATSSSSSPLSDQLDVERTEADQWSFDQALNLRARSAAALSHSSNSLEGKLHFEEEEEEEAETNEKEKEEEEAVFGVTPSHRNDLLLAVSEFRAMSGSSMSSFLAKPHAKEEFHMSLGDQETLQMRSRDILNETHV